MNRLLSHPVVALSSSSSSLLALKYAILLARQSGGTLTAVYVVDTATISRLSMSRIFVEDEALHFRNSLEQNGRRCLAHAVELAAAKGIQLRQELRFGAMGPELLDVVREQSCDCLILGSWEQTHAAWDLLTASYRELFLHSPCPILLARSADMDSLWASC